MINGLKLAMSRDEVMALLDARIERIRAVTGVRLDAIAGNEQPPRTDYVCQVPAEVVEDEGELLPDPPAVPSSTELPGAIRWVTHPVDVSAALQPAGGSGD